MTDAEATAQERYDAAREDARLDTDALTWLGRVRDEGPIYVPPVPRKQLLEVGAIARYRGVGGKFAIHGTFEITDQGMEELAAAR